LVKFSYLAAAFFNDIALL